ncbi:MAG: alpha-L-rhamnosidase C-terminal domain-containing protein [Armatimonadota bacterium]
MTESSRPFADAQWIFIEDEPSPENFYLAARKTFTLEEAPEDATLHISADTRYVLYVNGQRVGRGPNRCWPFDQQYDSHDVARHLRVGENVIAVLVHHVGVSTYQYMPGRGGLLARLESGGETLAQSDGSWKVTRHTGWRRRVPRSAMQMGWAEQFDAREDLSGPLGAPWMAPEFDDSAWANAVEIGPVGTEPWTGMSPREIPFLTHDPVYPARFMSAESVRPPQHTIDVRFHDSLPEGELADRVVGLVATVIRAPQACSATLLPYGRLGFRGASLNGRPLTGGGRDTPAPMELEAGDNLLVIDSGTTRTYATLDVAIDAQVEVELASPLGGETPFAVSVFDPTIVEDPEARIEAALAAEDAGGLAAVTPAFEALSAEDIAPFHGGMATQFATVLDGAPRIDDPQALCAANAEVTTVHPNDAGETRLLIDFGEEVNGLLEFEVDAPKGAVLNFYGFEAFVDGAPQWTRIDAGLLYFTREGTQRFLSAHRRGLRYMFVTVSHLSAPLRIRELRMLFHTMPLPARGAFRCSDELLNRIWEMCRHTLRCCMEDTFVDCPLYEQALWVGDARNEALIAYAAFGTYEFTKRCWRLAAQSMFRSPVPESRVPSGDEGILTAWAELWVLACEEQYLYDADLDFQREIYPAVAETLRNFLGMRNEDGLLEIAAWNMIDWAAMDTPRDGVVTHNNAWLVEALRRGAMMSERVGEDDGEEFEAAAVELAAAINEHLWDEDAEAYIDSIHADGTRSEVFSQQTQTVCYLCEVVTDERMPAVKQHVYDPPEEFIEIGSPFFMFFSCEALSKLGLYETIVAWVRDCWGEMLRYGATTVWEMFGDKITRSRCHAWSAGPLYFLEAHQLGVEPALPGFERATIAPIPLDLDWCEGRMPTPHGEIEVAWERDEQMFGIGVGLPDGVRADVILPCETEEFDEPKCSGDGVEEVVRAAGLWKVRLRNGARVAIEALRC